MQIQIGWLLQKPADLDLHCLQGRVYPGSAGQGLKALLFSFQDNFNLLFDRAVAALREDKPIRVVNALLVSLPHHSVIQPLR